jgi:hypothetical protein
MKGTSTNEFERDCKKYRVKGYLKTILAILLLIFAYAISVITSSFEETNKKFILVLLCALFGFVGFYVVYGICYLLAQFIYSIKAKKVIKSEIQLNTTIENYFIDKNYSFKYDRKKSFSSNVAQAKSDMLDIVKDIANGFNKGKGKYYYLNYSIYDAVSLLDTTIELFDSKITPVFKFLKAEDKPLNVVEKLLTTAIEKENSEVIKEPSKGVNFIKKIGSKILNTTAFIFKGVIENTINSLVVFIGSKAFEVYCKSGNKFNNVVKNQTNKEGRND